MVRDAFAGIGGGGYQGAWTGKASKGDIVTRGLYAFGCNADTSVDPCIDFGNLGDNTLIAINGTGTAQDVVNKILQLNGGANGQDGNAIYKTNVSGWDKRRLVFDLQITGTADGLSFGILDGSKPSNTASATGMAAVAGFWGCDIEIYAGGTPGYFICHNGVKDPVPFADTNANICNAGSLYDRYFVDFVDNGAIANTCTITLYRNAYALGAVTNSGWADEKIQLGTWTVARPGFTDWKLALGAHTGGSSANFRCKRAFAISKDTTLWTPLGLLPVRA